MVEEKVIALFKQPDFGLIGLERFRQKLKEKNIIISKEKLKKILDKLGESELFQRPKISIGSSITETGIRSGYQCDLIDFSLLHRRNKGFKWILTCIDVYSRYAWAIALKKKTGPEVVRGLITILKNGTPERITTDNGKEFTNTLFQKLLRDNNIRHFLNQPGDHNTMGLIERFNRTVRERLGRNFERIGRLN